MAMETIVQRVLLIVCMIVYKRPAIWTISGCRLVSYKYRLYSIFLTLIENSKDKLVYFFFTDLRTNQNRLNPRHGSTPDTMAAPSPQAHGVQPDARAMNCGMGNWVDRIGEDSFTSNLTECCVLATWTAEANKCNSVMHVVGDLHYQTCINKLVQQIRTNLPAATHVIAVSGPDGATRECLRTTGTRTSRTT